VKVARRCGNKTRWEVAVGIVVEDADSLGGLIPDPVYESARQTAGRLTTGIATVHRLINARAIPSRSINGRRKIPKLAVGQLLASAYKIWPPESRPQYITEELRRLAGITVQEVAAQLGIGRSAAYEAVRKHQIPAKQLPRTDRWVVPEDVVAQMQAYDLTNFTPMSLTEHPRGVQPLNTRASDPGTDDEAAAETSTGHAGKIRQVEHRGLGTCDSRSDAMSHVVGRAVRALRKPQ